MRQPAPVSPIYEPDFMSQKYHHLYKRKTQNACCIQSETHPLNKHWALSYISLILFSTVLGITLSHNEAGIWKQLWINIWYVVNTVNRHEIMLGWVWQYKCKNDCSESTCTELLKWITCLYKWNDQGLPPTWAMQSFWVASEMILSNLTLHTAPHSFFTVSEMILSNLRLHTASSLSVKWSYPTWSDHCGFTAQIVGAPWLCSGSDESLFHQWSVHMIHGLHTGWRAPWLCSEMILSYMT